MKPAVQSLHTMHVSALGDHSTQFHVLSGNDRPVPADLTGVCLLVWAKRPGLYNQRCRVRAWQAGSVVIADLWAAIWICMDNTTRPTV